MPCRAVSRHSRAPNAVFMHNEWGSSALPCPGAGGVNPSFSAIAGSSCLISSSSWKFSIFVSPFPLLYFTLGTSSLRKKYRELAEVFAPPQTCSSVVRTLLNRISGNPRQQEYTIHSAVFQPFHVVFYSGPGQRGYSARQWFSYPVRLVHRCRHLPCRVTCRYSCALYAVFFA